MATLEQVEKLRQKVDCSYEEAKSALEACDGDMLEALIYLEKKGKESRGSYGSGSYSTKDGKQHGYSESNSHTTTHTTYTSSGDSKSFSEAMNRFFAWLGKLIKQGNINYLDIINHDKIVLSIPLTVLVLLMIFLFWFMVPALIIGLFCGLRYQFRGKDFRDGNKANDYMNDASKAAENAKQKVRVEFSDDEAEDGANTGGEGQDGKTEGPGGNGAHEGSGQD